MKKNIYRNPIIIFAVLGALIIPIVNTVLAQLNPTKTMNTPSQVLALTNWKLTLPTGSSESPTEIKQPALSGYEKAPWFMLNEEKNGVLFRAPVNGVTTKNSGYPRSELREMTKNGTANASWSSTSGTHTLILDQAISAVPEKKPHVVAGQIHDASDDVIVIRLEYPKLYVNVDGKNKYVLDNDYELGKRFTVKFIVKNGQTKVYYNDRTDPVYSLNKNYSKAYFKAGAYTQSNCDKEGSELCNTNNYGEVILYDVRVSHK